MHDLELGKRRYVWRTFFALLPTFLRLTLVFRHNGDTSQLIGPVNNNSKDIKRHIGGAVKKRANWKHTFCLLRNPFLLEYNAWLDFPRFPLQQQQQQHARLYGIWNSPELCMHTRPRTGSANHVLLALEALEE